VQQIVQQLSGLQNVDTKADVARTTPKALTAAQNVLRWCDSAVETAQALLNAKRVEDAAPLAMRLATLTQQLAGGTNTSVTRHSIPSDTEGGLLYVQLQLQMLKVGRDALAAAPTTAAKPKSVSEQPRPPIPLGPSAAASKVTR
jgi:hypothetical protein